MGSQKCCKRTPNSPVHFLLWLQLSHQLWISWEVRACAVLMQKCMLQIKSSHLCPCYWSQLHSRLFFDPATEFSDCTINARLVSAGTAITPTDHSGQEHSSARRTGQRTSRVTLEGGKWEYVLNICCIWCMTVITVIYSIGLKYFA